MTVLLTTHYMEEAQRLADRVAIMDHGKLVAFGTPEQLTKLSASDIISFSGPEGLDLSELTQLPFAGNVREDRPGRYVITTTNALDCVAALAAWRKSSGVQIVDLRVSGASLEDVFLQLTGEAVRD